MGRSEWATARATSPRSRKSPELGKTIALGLFKGGLAHAGKTVVAAYPLKGEEVRLKIVSPHFIDQEGERLNA